MLLSFLDSSNKKNCKINLFQNDYKRFCKNFFESTSRFMNTYIQTRDYHNTACSLVIGIDFIPLEHVL